MPVYKEEEMAKYPNVDFSKANAVKSDVDLYLYQTPTQSDEIHLTPDTLHLLDPHLPTKVISHGFTTNRSSPWYAKIKAAYFAKAPHNIILIDWSKAGNLTYGVSSANVQPVGQAIAELLVLAQLPPDLIHLIGYSLGAHLMAFTAKHYFKQTGNKINRVTGLDAAGPGFEKAGAEWRLDEGDASFVDVVHTDMGYFGIIKPIGHVDFYVNGGKNQPGHASNATDENFSHRRAVETFIESISFRKAAARRGKFVNWLVVPDEAEENEEEVIYGDGVQKTARGIYFVKTGATPPLLS